MRKKLFLLVLLAVVFCLPAGLCAYRLEEVWQRTFEVEEGAKLSIENVNGAIDVEGWEENRIDITAEIRIKAPSKSKARKLFRKLRFDVDEDPKRVSIEADLPKIRQDSFLGFVTGDRTSITIHYKVKVPRRTSLKLKTVNGALGVIGVEGEFDLSSVNGSVEIEAIDCHGKISTVNGSIDCAVEEFPEGNELRLKTVNGSIRLGLPDEVPGKLEASTINGRVTLKRALMEDVRIKRRSVKGVLGEGEGLISLRTVNGRISVR